MFEESMFSSPTRERDSAALSSEGARPAAGWTRTDVGSTRISDHAREDFTDGAYALSAPSLRGPRSHPALCSSSNATTVQANDVTPTSSRSRTAAPSASASKKRMNGREKLTSTLDHLKAINWTIADFLYHLFRLKDERGQEVRRDSRHGTIVGTFLAGGMRHTAAEVVSMWLQDQVGRPKRGTGEFAQMYSLDIPWEELRHARVALTSMSAQLCRKKMLREQRSAVRGVRGLHGSAPGLRGHRQLCWADIGQNTVMDVQDILKADQPLTWQFLMALASPAPRQDDTGAVVVRKSRPPSLVATEVLSTLNFSRTKFARLLPAARSIMYFACGVPRTLYDYSSRVGHTLSWSATYQLLTRLASQDRAEVVALAQSPDRWPIVRMDNVQQYHKQREKRLGRENAMKIGVAATVAEALEFVVEASDLDDRQRRIAQNHRKDLTVDKLTRLVDWDFTETCFVLQWLQTLVNYVPTLARYKSDVAQMWRTGGTKMRAAAARPAKTAVHPLGTVAKNESIATDLRDTIVDFLAQMGQTEESFHRRLIPVGGDGLTFEKLVQIKNQLQFQDNEFRRFDIIFPFLETWHTEWTYLSTIFEVHWGRRFTDDPSALGHSAAKIDQKEPVNLKKVDYYPSLYLAYLVLDARMLDCWRTYYAVDDLFAHFEGLSARDELPELEELRSIAKTLHSRYSCQRAWFDAMEGGDQAEQAGWSAGASWKMKDNNANTPIGRKAPAQPGTSLKKEGIGSGHTNMPKFSGDRTLAQSILYMMDAMLSRDAADAVAMGDVGRLWNDMKIMMFKFEGSSHSKYGTYLLEQICSLELESSEALRTTFLKNWLVNPSGEPGKTLEGDLFEEHVNLILEESITRKDAEWDNTFLREVISPNACHFIELKNLWGVGVGLAKRRGYHPEPHSRPEIRKLLETYREEELHLFRKGRSYDDSPPALNTFQDGVKQLDNKKLKRFISESCRARVVLPAGRESADRAPGGEPIGQSASEPSPFLRPHRHTGHAEEDAVDVEDIPGDYAESQAESSAESEPGIESGDESEPETELTRGRVEVVDGVLVVGYEDDGPPDAWEDDRKSSGESSEDEGRSNDDGDEAVSERRVSEDEMGSDYQMSD
ncbi:hypothetical protein NUW54_g4331 [Trametes sanguinea]|uniref:Uncharacterized protein n=1 Tax=Trametes sanguinea TaxID=158606 RepID=A0ACC1Q045_9APHY|nr:hypothetical protein NUW54_g4331 [Trametes sanguinea]